MATQEREIVDLLWDNDRADALDKIKDMLQVKAAAAVDTSKLDVANRMFPHVPDVADQLDYLQKEKHQQMKLRK